MAAQGASAGGGHGHPGWWDAGEPAPEPDDAPSGGAGGDPEMEEHGSPVLSRFDMHGMVGEGTYGKVYKVVDKQSRQPYALKKIPIQYDEEGVPSTAIREVSLVRECNHPNIIRLYEVISTPYALHLLFEFLDMDLRMYLRKHGAYTDPPALRGAAYQCSCAIEYIHLHRIIHRDLKPQNVLIDIKSGRLKLADFGLARAYSVPLRVYTHEVVTLWYRAIEILLGQTKYATPTDIWSLGCIVAEMATAKALFPGDSQIDTIFKIFRVLGTPTDEVWPGVSTLREFKHTFPRWPATRLESTRSAGPALGDTGIEMLQLCFAYNPVNRLSAQRLKLHAFFEGVEPEVDRCAITRR